MSSTDLAGFWLRFVAFIIDSVVLAVVYLLLIIPLYGYFFPDHYDVIVDEVDPSAQVDIISFDTFSSIINLSQAVLLVVFVVYHTAMEASRYQASLGKLALELRVTNTEGLRVPFSRALLRNVSKLFSMLLLMVGFLMVAVTKKKQALHDIIARTLVVKN